MLLQVRTTVFLLLLLRRGSLTCGRMSPNLPTEKHQRIERLTHRLEMHRHSSLVSECFPKRRPRLTGGGNSDSPGDVEPSQDIIWDSTSPTSATSGITNIPCFAGFRCTKVEISDLVNRIAPKDVKPQKSSLLQWIGDSAVSCTPDIPKPKTRKRPNEMARQFDENMQQDKDMNEKMHIINNNNKSPNPVDPKEPALSCDPEEAALRALFDGSTQKVSGPLSQGSTSSMSQEVTRPPVITSSHKAVRAEKPHKVSESNKCDDFDDDWDWENDELLSDSLLMAIAPEQHSATTKTSLQTNTKCIPNVKLSTNANHAPKVLNVHSKPSYSQLQALCPKPKTTNRSTFKLGPEPVIHPPTGLPNQPPESRFTAVKSSNKTKHVMSADNFSDSLWDDGDDALLYQVCDSVESISNSQPHTVNPSGYQDKCNMSIDGPHKATIPVPIKATNTSVKKQSAAFVRSNSLPATSSASPNYQGWDKPTKSSTIKPLISQSFPGNHASIGSFSHINHNPSTANSIQKSSHTAFKRNVSDSAVICKKASLETQVLTKSFLL
uniref:Uncharacterized protein n=1 Tax=Neogobius melanostomus TaxID=47308 RepID=A0A8C6UHA1_9GOBI